MENARNKAIHPNRYFWHNATATFLTIKKQTNKMTSVKFLIDSDDENSVFAYFPGIPYSHGSRTVFTAYSSEGQRSPCCNAYSAECKRATSGQYDALLKELIRIGYNNLIMVS